MNLFNTARFILMSLVVFFLFNSCGHKQAREVSIVWNDYKAVQLIIPGKVSASASNFQIFVSPGNGPAILGNFIIGDDKTIFEPFIPLTRGFSYRVMLDGKLIDTVKIPAISSSDKPQVIAIHPSTGSVPENLLKLYIEFSKPMKEGEALQYLSIVNDSSKTLSNVFLDLQPELWNNDGTILTVWFDPGRIKRDLQPNLTLGPPLTKDEMYMFRIKQDWEAKDGSKMQKPFMQVYFTHERDSISPDPSKWELSIPKAGSTETLLIRFGESLDYQVAMNAIHIMDNDNKEVPGKISIGYPGEDFWQFVPDHAWQKGNYTLWVESKLEDLAGNNLDHPFDNDITQLKKGQSGEGYKRVIQIN